MAAIDLSTVRANMSDLFAVTKDLHGVDVDDHDGVQNKRQFAADISRELLFLADQFELLAALTRNEYWQVKGYTDQVRTL